MKSPRRSDSGRTGRRDPGSERALEDIIEMPPERVRQRALEVLREGRFKLADDLLARADLDIVSLVENLRVYQAELEIQNEELLRNQRQIQDALARFAAFFNTLPVAELVIDHKGLVLEANPAAQTLLGLTNAHLNQHFLARLIEEVDRGAVVGAWSKLSVDEHLRLPEIRFRNLGEGGFIGDLHIAPLVSPLGEVKQYVCAVIDRSESVAQRRSLYESSERLRRSESELRERYKELNVLHDVLAETARHDVPVDEILRHLVERLPHAWRFPDLAEARIRIGDGLYQSAGFVQSDWRQSVDLTLAEDRVGEIQVAYRERPPVVEEDEPFIDEERLLLEAVAAHVAAFLGHRQDEERLDFLASHDPLTELPNRSMFHERLRHCIQRAERYRRQFALLFLDLDHFKEINDTLGHPFGDALLRQVAEILTDQVRAVDTIARLGGDEFVVILEDIPEPRFAARFADRLMNAFGLPVIVVGHEIFVTASIGISVYPQDGRDMDSLIRHADIAMYQAKGAGRNAYRFFEPLMSDGLAKRMRLEHQLRGALDRNEFVLHYQPQLTLDGRRLRGIEAFCRWMHPELGLLPPERFLPLTEELGLIKELGYWVLEEACKQLSSWDRAGIRVPRLAVNLTMSELSAQEAIPRVRQILERYGIEPARVEVELAESKLMRCAEASVESLKGIHDLGVSLAVDDFGAGFSSLVLLQRLPLRRLKIDRSIVAGLGADSDQQTVVRAVVSLACSLGLGVLAEGIETLEQAELLIGEGCEEGQGFLFCEPRPPADLVWSWSA